MPRYYCDYCDTYLTHDSPVVRKQHNTGYKHKANVRNYYMQFEEAQTQELIDSKIMEHLAKAGAGPGQIPGPISIQGGAMNSLQMRPQSGPGYGVIQPQSIPYRPPAGMGGPPGPGAQPQYRPPTLAPPAYATYAPR